MAKVVTAIPKWIYVVRNCALIRFELTKSILKGSARSKARFCYHAKKYLQWFALLIMHSVYYQK